MSTDTRQDDTRSVGHDEEVAPPRAPQRHESLDALDVLVGDWRVEGRDLDGGSPSSSSLTRRWMPGGHFLIQETRSEAEAHPSVEYIGYDHARHEIRSMLFGAEGPGPFCSFALEYVWDLDDGRLTIWHGDRGSPARFVGDVDGLAGTVTGRWEWPGGGYLATATRVG